MELVIHDAGYWRTTTFGDSTVHWKDSLGHVAAELETTSVGALAQSARKQRGNWAAIVEAGGKIHLVTDAARSYPIHYAALGDTLHVSSRMEDFRGAVPYRRNEQATREFLHSGWVLGSDTLIEGVSTVRSSTIHTFDAPGSSAEHPYIDYVPSARLEESSADYLSRFASALRRSYLDLLEAAGDRQLIVPLSGGVDSRIQLAVLADVGAPHVATFTYGRPDSAEARVSKEIAKQAGRPWFFIETTEDAIRSAWQDRDNNEFLEHAWSGNALPHIQDWFALRELCSVEGIDPNGIIIPGHTAIKTSHIGRFSDEATPMSREDMVELLAARHLNLRDRPCQALEHRYTRAKIEAMVADLWGNTDVGTRNAITNKFHFEERHAKYICNSVRAYEDAGFSWALPMCTNEITELFTIAPADFQDAPRSAYRRFVESYYAEHVGGDSAFYQPKAAQPSRIPGRVKSMLMKSPIPELHRRWRSTGVQVRHPMAFTGFLPEPVSKRDAWRIFHGLSLFGMFAELFVTNRWVPGQDVLPE